MKLTLALSILALAGCVSNQYQTAIYPERIEHRFLPVVDLPAVETPVVLPPVVDQPVATVQPPPIDTVVVVAPPPRIGHGPTPVPLPFDLEGL